jgi:type I restriction enzyme S subunit
MTSWKSNKLGNVINLKRGYDLPSTKRINGKFPILSSSGISGQHNACQAKGPGVVTGRYGTIGQVFYIEGDYWPLNTTLYVQDFKGNVPKFIYYFLKTFDFYKYNDKSTVPGINRNHLHEEIVSIPDLQTQSAIAEILSAFDDKIELNNQTNQELEVLAQALFKQWFIDFEFPNDDGQPYKSAGGEMVESELGTIPNGWTTGTIHDMADVKGGKRLPNGSELTMIRTDHPYIRVRDFSSGKVDISNILYVPDQIWPSIKNYIITKEDVYITIVGTIGLVGMIPPELDKANLTENAAKIISKNGVYFSKYFLSLYLNTKQGQDEIRSRTVGSTQPKLAIFRIREIPLVIPTRKALESFDLLIEGLFTSIFTNDLENNTLVHLRDALIPKLISGELGVQNN